MIFILDLQTLSTDGSGFIKKLKDYFLTVGEGTVELTINLVVMVLVERFYDQQGLGVYSYLLSLLFIISYISEFGIPRLVEHEIAKTDRHPDEQSEILAKSRQTSLCLSLMVSFLLFLTAGYDAAHTRIGERAAAYLILGAILPLRSLNTIKLSVLHGYGQHDVVAKLQTLKRVVFLGAVSLLLLFRVPPSLRLDGVKVRFIFGSDDDLTAEGVYVDQIRIVATTDVDTEPIGNDTYGARLYEMKNAGQIAGL
ncbi:MAG: oligosaccharide flippase family protein, partial [Desulfobacterales bacterium]